MGLKEQSLHSGFLNNIFYTSWQELFLDCFDRQHVDHEVVSADGLLRPQMAADWDTSGPHQDQISLGVSCHLGHQQTISRDHLIQCTAGGYPQ